MRSLFATIFAVTASTALPAIATSINHPSTFSPINPNSTYVSVLPVQQTAIQEAQNAEPHTFAQRSLNIAKQIPTDAIGLLVVDIDRGSWQTIQRFHGNSTSQLGAMDKLLGFLGKASQISFAKDVQPWLGTELAIAFLNHPDQKAEIIFAGMSVIKDQQQFDAFIKKLKGLNFPKASETLYQNVRIWEWQLQEEDDSKMNSSQVSASNTIQALNLKQSKLSHNHKPTKEPQMDHDHHEEPNEDLPKFPSFGFKRLAIAKLPSGVAVIASDRQAIQKMIDLAIANAPNLEASQPPQPLPSLADNDLFLRSLHNPLWNRSLIAGYGNFKSIGQFWELLAADLPETTEIPGFSRDDYIQSLKYTMSQYSSFDLFTWSTPKGIRSQSNSYFSSVRSPQPRSTEPRDRLLSFLPLNVYGAITSRNLNRQWQWFVEESKSQPSYKIFVEGLRMLAPLIFGSGLKLDIEKDVISWMDGEYALVAFPSDRAPFKEIGIDLTIGALIRTSKPEVANATLNKLTKYFSDLDKDFLQVKKRQVGTTLLTSFEFPDQRERGKTQSIFAYGWRDRQTLLLTLGANTASAFIPIPKPALAESEDFRDAIAEMPQPNFGYFYINANALAKQVANAFFLTGLIPLPNEPIDDPKQPPKIELPEPVQKIINRLGGAVFVYSETSDRFQSDFFLGIKP
ncbi:DUF3352 domain-containing protein [Pseudanabaena yagii]|uniref:DUF3352 domain-containing protein n=1 Tax=Pseudanabaena yagii GIHE-NHR1 TaxID=2722753 RepID=A0ABX1LVZ4_9CYAN|nr:DUF3352 domain-containing protein [Pseudanabaena yagii]NMF60350.1 DUF3352 domain-containing protein [Pseudanabaena yagii GIHE-NHR1]